MKRIYTALAFTAVLVLSVAGCRRSEVGVVERGFRDLVVTATRGEFVDVDLLASDSSAAIVRRAFGSQGVRGLQGSECGRVGAFTRATEGAFESRDSVGLYVHTTNPLGATGVHTANLCYATYDGVAWSAEGYLTDILKSGVSYYATAYYPFVRNISDPAVLVHSVSADQSVAGAVSRSDFMYSAVSSVVNPASSPSISLGFRHLLSKVAVRFTVPSSIDGALVSSVSSVSLRGVNRSVRVSLVDGGLSGFDNRGDVKLLHSGGVISSGGEVTYEGVVVPQAIGVGQRFIDILFDTDRGVRSYSYTLTESLDLVGGAKHTVTLVAVGDLSFSSTLDLTDGLAHRDLPLRVKAPAGKAWTVTSGAAWLKFSLTSTGVYSSSVVGVGTGGDQTIFVSVEANAAAVGSFWEPRGVVLTLSAGGVSSKYSVMQNFYRFDLKSSTMSVAAGQSVSAVVAFGANQTWSAVSAESWALLGTSSIFGAGNPAVSYGPVDGGLISNSLFYQIGANNSGGARSAAVIFTPSTAGGSGVSVTISQAAPTMTLVPSSDVRVAKGVGAGANLFTVTAPVGVKWQVLSVTPEAGKDMGLALSVGTGVQMVGTGAQQQVTGSYGANTRDSRYTNVVLGFAAMGATQQKTIKVTQDAAGPETITVNGTKWATGNLVADGANGCKVGAPGDGGLYFQYGGLIGYKGGSAGDGTGMVNATTHANNKFWGGAASFSTDDVAVTPAGYTSSKSVWPYYRSVASGGYGYYYFSDYATKYADFQGQANAYSVALGIGDPCAHYLGSSYRMPNYAELSAITGSTVEGNYVAWGSVTGKWVTNGPPASATIGAWFGPNAKTTPNVATDLFFPASGYRYYGSSGGNFYTVGAQGCYWSSSVYDAAFSFHLVFDGSSGAIPRSAHVREYGFPVRCVAK